MANTATVKIWNKVVGVIAWDDTTHLGSFEFVPSFLNSAWNISPLLMPLDESNGRIYTFSDLRDISAFKGLPGLLADVLPDRYGNALIETWLTRQGRPSGSLNPVETLLFIGKRGMGALEFEPPDALGQNKATKLEIASLVEISDQILSGRKNFIVNLSSNEQKALIAILKIGTSAGGARPKALIAYNPKTNEVKSGQAEAPTGFSHWLIKFDGVKDTQFGKTYGYGRVEMAYHLMAKDAGIEMTECRLYEEHDRAHFMTHRFDRLHAKEKLHVQSLCAMRHFDFNDKFSYSYEHLFETLRLLNLPYPQYEQVFRRMVFNVLSRNCDDHTKNFSFIMDKNGNWKLSPAFDVCHSYRPESEWVSQQLLSVNGKRKDINRNDFISVAKQMGVKKYENIIEQVNEVIQNWKHYASKVDVNTRLANAIQKTLIKV